MAFSKGGPLASRALHLMMIQRVQNLITGDKNSQLLLRTIHYTRDLPPASSCCSLLPGNFSTAAGELCPRGRAGTKVQAAGNAAHPGLLRKA